MNHQYFFPFYLVPIIMIYNYILHNAFFLRYFWQRNDFLWGQMPCAHIKRLTPMNPQAVCFSELWGKGWVICDMSDCLQLVLIINGEMLVIHITYIIDIAGGLLFIPDGSWETEVKWCCILWYVSPQALYTESKKIWCCCDLKSFMESSFLFY